MWTGHTHSLWSSDLTPCHSPWCSLLSGHTLHTRPLVPTSCSSSDDPGLLLPDTRPCVSCPLCHEGSPRWDLPGLLTLHSLFTQMSPSSEPSLTPLFKMALPPHLPWALYFSLWHLSHFFYILFLLPLPTFISHFSTSHHISYHATNVLVLFLETMAIVSVIFPISLLLFHLSLLKHISLASITKRLWSIPF